MMFNPRTDKQMHKTIVITGSTRGIGYGMADEFLKLGCAVMVSSRTQAAVDQAVTALAAKHGPERVAGHVCDVTCFEQVQALWEAAHARWGKVDVWINNAGMSTPAVDWWEQPAERIRTVVETNVVGAFYGSTVALRGMRAQGFGSLYNMEGLGSDGYQVRGLALYGSTKAALRYLDRALAIETRGTPVRVGALNPGMVATELITGQYKDKPDEWQKLKPIFNLISDRVETVTPWLARRVLANSKNGALISWSNPLRIAGRFLLAPFRKRHVFD